MDNSFQDFRDRFRELADEAHRYGVVAAWVLLDSNPIDKTTSSVFEWTMSVFEAIGSANMLVRIAEDQFYGSDDLE